MQKRITKELLAYLPARALPALASFITVPIYTRMFSPDQFGNYVLASAASEFLLLATITGFGQAAVRYFSAYQLKSTLSNYFAAIFGSVGLIAVVAAALSSGILVIFRSLIPVDLYPLLWASLAGFVAGAYFSTLTDILRAQEKSRWYSTILIGQCYGAVVFGLLFVLVLHMGIAGLIWGQTLAFVLAIIPLVWLTTRSVPVRPNHLNRSDLKLLWAFALPFTVGNIAFWMLTNADRYIIDAFRGSYDVGLYAVAQKMSMRSIQLLVGLFILVPAPMIARLWEERGRQATEEALTAFTRMFFLMIIPAVVGLSVVAAPLLRLLADKAYFGGYRAIWLVACASMGMGLSDLAMCGCLVANRTRLIAMNQLLAAVAGLILNLILVPRFGFMGAAWGDAIAFMLLVVFQAITSSRFLTWRWPFGSLWRVLLASAAMATAVLLVQAGLQFDRTIWQVVSLLVSIAVGGLVYGLVLWAFGEISPRQFLGFFMGDHRPPVVNSIGPK